MTTGLESLVHSELIVNDCLPSAGLRTHTESPPPRWEILSVAMRGLLGVLLCAWRSGS